MTACHNAVDFDEVMAFTSACRHEPQRPRAAQEMNFQVAEVAPTRITVKLSKFLSLPNPSQSSHLSGLWKWSMGVVMCYAYMYNIYIHIYVYIYITHVLFFWLYTYIYLWPSVNVGRTGALEPISHWILSISFLAQKLSSGAPVVEKNEKKS
jgi:hypothetical protein